MRRGGFGGLLTLVYVIIGAFVAGTHGYFSDVNDIQSIVSALLGILLWPLILLHINLKL